MQWTAAIELHMKHRVCFTRDVLDPSNPALAGCLASDQGPARAVVFVDAQVARCFPDLSQRLRAYAEAHADRLRWAGPVERVVSGERCKSDPAVLEGVLSAIDRARLDRHGYVLAIGGGAVLDCVGFAAAIAHRGVRLIRLPTTTLAQADSGVGVKNGVNRFGKKNYLGTFAVPWAVINDERFLATLGQRDWISGFAEAVKVALIKDAALFEQIDRVAAAIRARDLSAAMPIVQRSAQLHLEHIAAGGDPFEWGSARPLDMGHWSAHQLEVLTDFELRHGEAVAIGVALDAVYAQLVGLLTPDAAQAVCACLDKLGFALFHDAMRDAEALLAGLDAFREHLGGELTVTLPAGVGSCVEVHEIDRGAMAAAVEQLESWAAQAVGGSSPATP